MLNTINDTIKPNLQSNHGKNIIWENHMLFLSHIGQVTELHYQPKKLMDMFLRAIILLFKSILLQFEGK
jgi:hypothetical protein